MREWTSSSRRSRRASGGHSRSGWRSRSRPARRRRGWPRALWPPPPIRPSWKRASDRGLRGPLRLRRLLRQPRGRSRCGGASSGTSPRRSSPLRRARCSRSPHLTDPCRTSRRGPSTWRGPFPPNHGSTPMAETSSPHTRSVRRRRRFGCRWARTANRWASAWRGWLRFRDAGRRSECAGGGSRSARG